MNFNFASEGITSEKRGRKYFLASSPCQTVKELEESALFVELISCPTAHSLRCRPLIRQAFLLQNSKKKFRVCTFNQSGINTTENKPKQTNFYSHHREQLESVRHQLSIFVRLTTCKLVN